VPLRELFDEKEVGLAIQEITSGGGCHFRKRVLPIISKWSSSLTSVQFTGRALRQVRGKLEETARLSWSRRAKAIERLPQSGILVLVGAHGRSVPFGVLENDLIRI
jgi:hypothetical protein